MASRGASMMAWYLVLLFITSTLGIFQVFSVGDFGLVPLEAVLALLYIIVPLRIIFTGVPLRIPTGRVLAVNLALVASFTISALLSVVTGTPEMMVQSFKTWAHFLFMWGAAMLLWWYPIPASDWIKALRIHFAFAFILCLFAAYQLAARAFDLPLAWIAITNESFKKGAQDKDAIVQLALNFSNFYRATSIFAEPSALAIYAGMNLSMLLAAFFKGTRPILRSRWFLVASMFAAVLALFLAFSLTGIMVVTVTLILLSVLHGTAALRRLVPFIAVSILVLGVADRVVYATVEVSVLELFATRIESLITGKAQAEESGAIVGESVTQRTGDYRVSFEVWQEAPVFGVGPGNFGNSISARYHSTRYPATTYGTVISELGLVGMLVVGWFFVTLFLEALRAATRSASNLDPDDDVEILRPILPVIALILIFVALNSNLLVSAYFWLYAALICSGITAAVRQAGMEQTITIGVHPTDPHAAHH